MTIETNKFVLDIHKLIYISYNKITHPRMCYLYLGGMMNKLFDMNEAQKFLDKWQEILRLRDWEIRLFEVEKEWRKTGDIKIDENDRQAILMINNYNPKHTTLEPLIVHELLHLKLWGMDQMIESMMKMAFGQDESDPKYQFAFSKFMEVLEPTVEDLARSFIELGGDSNELSFGRVQQQVEEELKR